MQFSWKTFLFPGAARIFFVLSKNVFILKKFVVRSRLIPVLYFPFENVYNVQLFGREMRAITQI